MDYTTRTEGGTLYITPNTTNAEFDRTYIPADIDNIVIEKGVTSIGDSAFCGCTGLTSITLPDSVTSIGDSAFDGCTGLTSITLPDGVTSIGDSAFDGCTGLTSITIPDSVTSIGRSAFCGCTGLTSITIPDSVTNIGWNAFCGCTGLTSITIPDSVTSIGKFAFEGCTGLTKKGKYKATNGRMQCRKLQYSLGQEMSEQNVKLCKSGFHYCENAFDLLNYYYGKYGKDFRAFDVEVDQVSDERSEEDSKRVCGKIKLVREYKNYAELLNAGGYDDKKH